MTAQELILVLAIGGILGVTGQGVRVIVGLKKVYDASVRQQAAFGDLFRGSQIAVSLMIGFIAGVLGIVTMFDPAAMMFTRETLVTLIGVGYAGSDFIEGFVKKYLPEQGGALKAGRGPAQAAGDDDQPAVG